MKILRIEGGRPLHGDIEIPGSKNAALAILSAVMLGDGQGILHNVPEVSDIHYKLKLLSQFGAKVHWHEGTLVIDCGNISSVDADEDVVHPIRTSFYLLGTLLARAGKASLPAPGGCKIGARPVDFHIKGLRAMGAEIELDGGRYVATVKNGLHGAKIHLDFPSAGATQHLMATATLASGVTEITNAAIEPEVTTLADFLIRMGARIEGAGTSNVTIIGVEKLQACEFRVPEDRLQAGTFLLGGAITRGDVTVRGIMPEHQNALISKLQEAGADATEGPDWIRVASNRRLKGIKIKTMPYPGFPTDIQQPMAAVLGLSNGVSVVEETIYESRIGHVSELNRMGAQMQLEGRFTIIEGVKSYQGAQVEASDLRAGAALVLAGLAAEGETVVRNVHFIERGYERFEEILTTLGACIRAEGTPESERAHGGRLGVT